MTEKQSRQLDLILKTLINNEGKSYDIDRMNKEILPEESIDDCRVLFHILNNHYPALLYPISGPSEESFWTNDYAKAFITEGGFSKLFDDEFVQENHNNEFQKLSLEKLKYDTKNAKRIFKTYWWTFFIALLAFLISLYNFIKGLL